MRKQDFYTGKEAAQMLKIPTAMLYMFARVTGVKKIYNTYFFKQPDIDEIKYLLRSYKKGEARQGDYKKR